MSATQADLPSDASEAGETLPIQSLPTPLAATSGQPSTDIARLKDQLSTLQRELKQLKSSTSWRLTAPLRNISGTLRSFFRGGRKDSEKHTLPRTPPKPKIEAPAKAVERQYQSFAGIAGGSDSEGKLERLMLQNLMRPRSKRPLEGFSVLDLGCNEGFFSNAARELGATRVVGIDHSQSFIERARHRFPGISFLHGSWWEVPDEKFDLILFLSAIHYEPEQKRLLDFLATRLKPEGTLVLECGIVEDAQWPTAPAWRAIERHDGLKRYPTLAYLKGHLLSHYAVRVTGASVMQRGDPVPRTVLHCGLRRPVALLIGGSSMVGKTALADQFREGGILCYSTDRLFWRLINDESYHRNSLSQWLREVMGEERSWVVASQAIVRDRRQNEFAELIGAELPGEGVPIFALEGEALCHESIRAAIMQVLEERGTIIWRVDRQNQT